MSPAETVMPWRVKQLAFHLDCRISGRLLPIQFGLLFVTGRRTVSSWLRAGELSKDYRDNYYFPAPSAARSIRSPWPCCRSLSGSSIP
jgi:hypothetical protein